MLRKRVAAAIAVACVFPIETKIVSAQEAPTPGGNVTADQASVLPPVVVSAPDQPLIRPAKQKPVTQNKSGTPGGSGQQSTAEVGGEGSAPGIATGAFTLGQIDMIGGSTITNEAMWTFNKQSLGEAVNLLPGVSWASTGAPSANSSGSRNEGDIFVRGFNRFQVPLSIDGVRVYLPADNRIDMNRFLTPDLAEVQVAKGYVSVLNGPGGEGGAINLVSRKPTKEVELEGRAGVIVNGDVDDLNSWNAYAYAGTRQKGYYAQLSGTIVDQDHFNLSHDFTPANSSTQGYANGVAEGFSYEDGGDRDHSAFRDWRINTKVGITPNATDEYSINYTNQQSEKDSPLHVDRQIVQGYFNGSNVRYWQWPEWNTSSLSWLSKTKLGDASYIKTNAYYNTFDNTISFYPNATYTNQTADSPYEDYSYGGFVEMGTDLIPMNTLKGSIHYRKDAHSEHSVNYDYSGATTIVTTSGFKRQAEEVWSFAAENTFHATSRLDLVAGVSFDTDQILENSVSGKDAGSVKPYSDAWNWQTAAIYRYSQTGTVHADVSSRTRFPTLFDRYSTRFDAKDPDPNVDPERATNYEIGFSDVVFGKVKVSPAVFYSDIYNSIQNAYTAANSKTSIVGISPDGHYYGAEISIDWDVTPTVRIGGNYTYMERELDFAGAAADLPAGTTQAVRDAVAASELEAVPRHKGFIYLAWKATDKLTFTPNVELAADRIALVTSCSSTLVSSGGNNATPISSSNGNCAKASSGAKQLPSYVNIGAYTLVNIQAEYAFNPNTTLALGGTNLLDQNYSLAEGFPEPGRQFFANLRARF
ncbi:MAG: TonB-dependent receptor [Hyphomicrobium sp.]|uniref:TonB-dependent receptor plug domain-containing protein n=1 Tax=Hyphomicrobium sp. TaxID=82 RepID=UPI0039E59189